MRGFIKIALILFGIVVLLHFIFMMIVLSAFGGFDKSYSTSDLKEEYINNKDKISQVINYYNSIVSEDKIVEIEFEDGETIARFGIYYRDSTMGKNNFLDWDLKLNSSRTDSIMKTINWNNEILKTLKNKLDGANCIQIKNGEPTQVGFARSGMGMYFFNIFKNPINYTQFITDENYNDCNFRYVDPYLVLEYRGGAIGPQCFPEKDK
ncbi:hypothetical protein LEQ04_07145 [Riemerella anatipestifer]|nr:hypothetical protein LEQ05_11630 [Riemerella anatipestifer]WPC13816.1 hypothetical protein LEQ03_04025 [Riemerella anatipestifer]WPC14413.1 hypothetical protein LEQ04_07145 [Riemerella anatipestifer]